MLTARAAAALLAAAATVDSLAPLVATLGFDPPLPLDGATRTALGVPDTAADVRLARGGGALRALLLELPPTGGAALRDAVARTAARLAARTPHLLWLVAAVEREGHHTVLATWSGERSPPRVAALVVDRRAVVDSDAQTLRSLAATPPPSLASGPDAARDLLTHARWLDLLGRDSLTRAFYRTLERVVASLAGGAPGRLSLADRRELALLCTSRLLFLAFLEAKGWLAGDHAFLAHAFDDATARGRPVHRHLLLPLFFGTLNTPPRARAPAARAFGPVPYLNGGLFARTPLEKRARDALFPDEALGLLFGELLARYRFTAREDGAAWTEAAIDPEMLGKSFESLMAADERRASGAFYTPQPLVERVADTALRHALRDHDDTPDHAVAAALAGTVPADAVTRRLLLDRVRAIRILDPACGSGAFLVHALERLASLAATLGDPRPVPELRRAVLTGCIFGVDVNPTAVWLCELRLWLSVVIESDEPDPWRVPPLPNIDRHVRVGDSLAGGAFAGVRRSATAGRRLAALRDRYARASGTRKRTLGRVLEREERSRALAALDAALESASARRRELFTALRTRDLFGDRRRPDAAARARLAALRETTRRLRAQHRRVAHGAALPFAFATHFADVADAGGFDVVVGNPPWVRLHKIPPATRDSLRREFRTFRNAPWRRGARAAHAGLGFAAQVDLAALFVERSHSLLRADGVLALLVPAKLWRSLASGGVRALLLDESELLAVEDWSESPHTFDAAVYPALVAARRRPPLAPHLALGGDRHGPPSARPITVVVRGRSADQRWQTDANALPYDSSTGSPWVLLPPDARRAFDCLSSAGTSLADSPLGRPRLGVKCGCNDAFIVEVVGEADDPSLARVAAADGRTGEVERALLRPLLRGEAIAPWTTPPGRAHLLWTLDEHHRPLRKLPPHALRWLAPWRARLASRADARVHARCPLPWWSLFRADGANAATPRVAWSDLARVPRATLLAAGDPAVPLNSCYVLPCPSLDDAHALVALLNASATAAWLGALAEPARGGYRRFMGWTVALLPLPRDWPRARALLAPLAAAACAGAPPAPESLDDAVAVAYGVARCHLAPLVGWTAR